MLLFMTSKVPFSAIFQIFYFLTQIRKTCAISEVSAKNRTNMWTLAEKLVVILIFQILHHNDVITITY